MHLCGSIFLFTNGHRTNGDMEIYERKLKANVGTIIITAIAIGYPYLKFLL